MTDLLLDDQQLPGDFAVYQRFNRAGDMTDVTNILRAHDVPVRVSGEEAGEWREATIMGSPLLPKFWIEIPANYFEKANYVLQDAAERSLSDEDLDAHPFAEYTASQLEEVLLEEGAWSPDAVVVARRLLLRSGHDVDLAEFRRTARERMDRAYEPRSGTRWVLIFFTCYGTFAGLAVWIVSLMISSGVLLYYMVGSRRDPKGVKHMAYNELTRLLGRMAVAVVVVALLCGLVNMFYLGWVAFPPIDVWYWLWF
jgi:hypothetical protein